MPEPEITTDTVLAYVRRQGIVRPSDLSRKGWSRWYIDRLMEKGLIERVGRGLYVAVDAEITANHTIAEACKRLPKGVICLISALRFHDLTTQMPTEVWMALPDTVKKPPKLDYPPLRVFYFSGEAFERGIQVYRIESVPVKVYCPAKTVIDCFFFRHKIGMDVVLEALKRYLRNPQNSVEDLWEFAKIRRVQRTIRPFVETLLA